MVDHINGNGLDNRKCNLRVTNSTVNNQNARKRKNAVTSKFKGVHKISNIKYTKRWVAQIRVNKKHHHLGYHLTELEAAKAYNEAVLKYFGVNFPLNKLD